MRVEEPRSQSPVLAKVVNRNATSGSRIGAAARWLGFAALVTVLAHAMWQSDLGQAIHLLQRAGPALGLAIVPYLLIVALDTAGWHGVFLAVGRPVPFSRLLATRLSCEAVNVSLPGGAVWSETLAPSLLHRHFGMSIRESIAALATKKWLLMLGHALYIFAGLAFGYSLLRAWSPALLGHAGLPWMVLLAGVLPLIAAVTMLSMLSRGAVAQWLLEALSRLPLRFIRAAIDGHRRHFIETGALLRTYTAAGKKFGAPSTLLFFASWMMEAVESYVILRLLGAEVGFIQVLAVDGVLSVVRSLTFFSPGGLGPQDLGFLLFFEAMGLPGGAAMGAAFVMVKRSKDLLWAFIGAALLLVKGPNQTTSSRSTLVGTGAPT